MIQVIRCAVFFTLVAFALSAPSDNSPQCIQTTRPCVRNSECCDGCCSGSKCVTYSDSCIAATNPCANFPCNPGEKCYLQQVQCIQAPCPPLPACKRDDKDYDYDE